MQDLLPVTAADVILALMEYLLLMVTVQVVVISGLWQQLMIVRKVIMPVQMW